MSHGAEHAEPGPAAGRRYSAFISYSHADAPFAKRLHRQLETYRLPARLTARASGRLNEGRLRPLFRDDDELEAAADLTAAVREALGRADALIVVCSAAAKASPWVAREIALFRELNPGAPVLAALAGGEPGAAFPEALLDGGREPLAADFRGDGSARRLALMKLVAVLAGVPLDELVQRDAQRRMQTLAFAAGGAVATLAVVAGLSVAAWTAQARADAERRRAGGLNEFMISDLRKGLEAAGRHDLLDKVNKAALGAYADEDLSKLTPDQQLQRAKTLQGMAKDSEKKGDLAAARAQAEAAYRITDALLATKPKDPERLFAHAQSEYWVGFVGWREGNGAEAKARSEAYERLAERLVATDPANDIWRMEKVYASNSLGTLALRQAGDATAAERHFRNSLAQIDLIATHKPGDRQVALDRANALAWLADALRIEGRLDDALKMRELQRQALEGLLHQDPRDVAVKNRMLSCDLAVARIAAARGQADEAISLLHGGRGKAVALQAEDPANTDYPKFARMFELFEAKVLLDSRRSGQSVERIAKLLRDCPAFGSGAANQEIEDFCKILQARHVAQQGDLPGAMRALQPVQLHLAQQHDVLTARWGLNLEAEGRLIEGDRNHGGGR